MSEYRNKTELEEDARTKRVEAGRAVMAGREAYLRGESIKTNPHDGWQYWDNGQHSHLCLLWCRWALGYLREHCREEEAAAAVAPHPEEGS